MHAEFWCLNVNRKDCSEYSRTGEGEAVTGTGWGVLRCSAIGLRRLSSRFASAAVCFEACVCCRSHVEVRNLFYWICYLGLFYILGLVCGPVLYTGSAMWACSVYWVCYVGLLYTGFAMWACSVYWVCYVSLFYILGLLGGFVLYTGSAMWVCSVYWVCYASLFCILGLLCGPVLYTGSSMWACSVYWVCYVGLLYTGSAMWVCSVYWVCYVGLFFILGLLCGFVLYTGSAMWVCSVYWVCYVGLFCILVLLCESVLHTGSAMWACSVYWVCYVGLFCILGLLCGSVLYIGSAMWVCFIYWVCYVGVFYIHRPSNGPYEVILLLSVDNGIRKFVLQVMAKGRREQRSEDGTTGRQHSDNRVTCTALSGLLELAVTLWVMGHAKRCGMLLSQLTAITVDRRPKGEEGGGT
jgi:hypothetical protein